MGKTYRSLHQWNHWLREPKGREILGMENTFLRELPDNLMRGKHGILIGVPEQQTLLNDRFLLNKVLLTPIRSTICQCALVESDPEMLPVASGSTDLVLLPHTLEYTSRPHHLLAEACRIVRPQGHIIVMGFNPLGVWGLRKIMLREKSVPMRANFLSPRKIRHWLGLSDFVLDRHEPQRLFGSLYVLVAEARVTPGTPIRLRWKQTLPAFRATLAGPSIREQV